MKSLKRKENTMAFSKKESRKRAIRHMKYRLEIYKSKGLNNTPMFNELKVRIQRQIDKVVKT